MHIIVGGTGHVGSATARSLLRRGEPVTIVTHHREHAADLAAEGAQVAVADIHDVPALRDILRSGTSAFLLNPPAEPSTDTDAVERANAAAIAAAVEGSGLRKVVAASTYGARPGTPCGDLTVLFEFEEALRARLGRVAVNRAAYYMSNWTGMLDAVAASGKLPSFFPADYALPMVAPEDLGEAAARRLIDADDEPAIRYVEGPRRYTAGEVAAAMAEALGKRVKVDVVPREQWTAAFRQMGFSERAAITYTCMTGTVLDESDRWPADPVRGATTLEAYIRAAVQRWQEAKEASKNR
ncbi:uncharacterized protein YbjT (DUF2867 family) [Pseudoduganella flava]|uniref:NAD(P)H-binding protein n=1 Tax=Pseudoduganella flava TaxID=871742 RepID=A0A562PCZ5_9BURK|nr:NAD(P)H-binding protein [Pseudoduganella flava]QGZ40051.1 NAD(P)H-binding protein [Pseudoduganella flava]TWI42203.1 uncharacterized protein YbjT (DUF2867 family) [Pseudoduganella flava]